jgi:hypothetical protein
VVDRISTEPATVPDRGLLPVTAMTGMSAALGMLLVLVGLSGGVRPHQAGPPQPGPATAEVRAQPDPPRRQLTPARRGTAAGADSEPLLLGPSRPVQLVIPRIGVRTPLVSLGLQPDGRMEVPPLRADAPPGWYRYLFTPGEPGPAVIVGHVDSARDGPAVFFRLGALRTGDQVDVRRADGYLARFTVSGVVSVPKKRFPTQAVYGDVRYPALRLITCGGSFDRSTGHYRNNVIVFARLISVDGPGGQP